jgi:hypothetical protein
MQPSIRKECLSAEWRRAESHSLLGRRSARAARKAQSSMWYYTNDSLKEDALAHAWNTVLGFTHVSLSKLTSFAFFIKAVAVFIPNNLEENMENVQRNFHVQKDGIHRLCHVTDISTSLHSGIAWRFIVLTVNMLNTGRFKKSFTTLKAYIHLFRGHVQCFELS